MDKLYEEAYHRLEENQWWFVSRREIIIDIIHRLQLTEASHILEVGCSGGVLLHDLLQTGFATSGITGIDISETAIETCRKRGLDNVIVMDGSQITFPDNHFDLVIASDTLEHIEDDKTALAEWFRIIKPGGNLIAFVPAFNAVWSYHDEINHHYRRYSGRELVRKLQESGFIIIRRSFWNFTLFFPACLIRKMQNLISQNRKNNTPGIKELSPVINSLLKFLISTENRILNLKGANFPVGLSVFAVCRKP